MSKFDLYSCIILYSNTHMYTETFNYIQCVPRKVFESAVCVKRNIYIIMYIVNS